MRDIGDFLEAVQRWAGLRTDVLAAILIGSHARGTARLDSDVDLVLVTADPRIYLDDTAWPQVFGEVVRIEAEDWGTVQSRRVFYADGLEVEFGITTREWIGIDPVDEGTRRIVLQGARILTDPHGLAYRLVQEAAGRTRGA